MTRKKREYLELTITEKELGYLKKGKRVRKPFLGKWYAISVGRVLGSSTAALLAKIDKLEERIAELKRGTDDMKTRVATTPSILIEKYLPYDTVPKFTFDRLDNAVRTHSWKKFTAEWRIGDQLRLKTHSIAQGFRCSCRSVGQKITVRESEGSYLVTRIK